MNAFQFLEKVADYLGEETGLDLKSSVERHKSRLEQRDFEQRLVNYALSEAVRAIAPDEATKLIGSKATRSSRVAGRLLLSAAKAGRRSEQSTAGWSAVQANLGLAFGLFLGLISRNASEEATSPELTLEERIASLVEERASRVLERWGALMVEPENLLLAAAAIGSYRPDERLGRMEQMVTIFSNLASRPSCREFRAFIATIWNPPTAKA